MRGLSYISCSGQWCDIVVSRQDTSSPWSSVQVDIQLFSDITNSPFVQITFGTLWVKIRICILGTTFDRWQSLWTLYLVSGKLPLKICTDNCGRTHHYLTSKFIVVTDSACFFELLLLFRTLKYWFRNCTTCPYNFVRFAFIYFLVDIISTLWKNKQDKWK